MGCACSKERRRARRQLKAKDSVPRLELSFSSGGSSVGEKSAKSTLTTLNADSDVDLAHWTNNMPQLPPSNRHLRSSAADPPPPPNSPPPPIPQAHTLDVALSKDNWDAESTTSSFRGSRANTIRSNYSGRVRAALSQAKRTPTVSKSEPVDPESEGRPPQDFGESGFGHSAVAWSCASTPQNNFSFSLSQLSSTSPRSAKFGGSTVSYASRGSLTSLKSSGSQVGRIATKKNEHHYYSYDSTQRKPAGERRESSRTSGGGRKRRGTAPAVPGMTFSEKSEFANSMRQTSAWAAGGTMRGIGAAAPPPSTPQPLGTSGRPRGWSENDNDADDEKASTLSIGTRVVGGGAAAGSTAAAAAASQRKKALQRNFSIPRRVNSVVGGESRVGYGDTFVP